MIMKGITEYPFAAKYLLVADVKGEVKTKGTWALDIVLVGVGIGLVMVSVVDMLHAFSPKQKDFKKGVIGVCVALLGAVFMVIGANIYLTKLQDLGNSVPK